MANDRVTCPFCGYRMPIEVKPGAQAHGLFIRCKGRTCGKIFEIVISPKINHNTLKPFGDWLETKMVPLLVDNLAEGIDSVGAAFDAVREPLQEFWQNTLKPIFAQIGTWIEEIVQQTTDSFGYFSEKVAEYKDEIAMVIEGIGTALQIIWSVISPILGSVVDGIGNVLSSTTSDSSNTWLNPIVNNKSFQGLQYAVGQNASKVTAFEFEAFADDVDFAKVFCAATSANRDGLFDVWKKTAPMTVQGAGITSIMFTMGDKYTTFENGTVFYIFAEEL